MNEVQLFNFENHEVRSLLISNEPWFVGKDVADVLGYADTNQAIRKHVDNEDRLTRRFDGTGQSRDMTIINESGLYSLVLSSKLPSAKKFKRWVTSEVLPALRKTGQYQVKELSGSELMAKALIEAQSVLAAKDKQIEEMKPKVVFADAVATSHTSILVGELAKILKQNGIDMGQKRLFAWLR
ncbi:BRO family protein [Catenibacterium sp.]|uniref:BRO family protein n=1 Tax=Catenibacterium sp. TaxID=2049022 RepID=UPI003AB663DB